MSRTRIFISGNPRSGKTTLVETLYNSLKNKYKIAGIISKELVRNGKRIGFTIEEIATKNKDILASVYSIRDAPKVGKYTVNLEGIQKIVLTLEQEMVYANLIVIDEIAPMEMYCKEFRNILPEILDSDKNLIATVHRSLKDKYNSLGKFYWLNKDNFEEVKNEILSLFYSTK